MHAPEPAECYDVFYAVGARSDKLLRMPDEDLPGASPRWSWSAVAS